MTTNYILPALGTLKKDIPTPALLINLDGLEANITNMAQFYEDKPAKLRPHFKTHKCPLLAQQQIKMGALGITCAKMGEAITLVEVGIGLKGSPTSILIANQVVDPFKIAALAEMNQNHVVMIAVDQENNLKQLSLAAKAARCTIPILIEVDIGMHRCGVQPGEMAIQLANLASQLPNIQFKGIMGYEGHTVFETDPEKRMDNVRKAMAALTNTATLIRQAGILVDIVSAGGTGTYNLTGLYPGVTEIQAGSYVFMDTKYRKMGLPFQNALTLLATVISRPSTGRAILDAGIKVLTTENGLPEVVDPSGAKLKALNEEHGILELAPSQENLKVGERVELIPSHVCSTVNLHDRFYAMRTGRLEAIWPITGRGKSQ